MKSTTEQRFDWKTADSLMDKFWSKPSLCTLMDYFIRLQNLGCPPALSLLLFAGMLDHLSKDRSREVSLGLLEPLPKKERLAVQGSSLKEADRRMREQMKQSRMKNPKK